MSDRSSTLPNADWTDALARRLDLPFDRPRVALTCAESASAIGSIEPALAQRMRMAGLPLIEAAGAFRIDAQGRDALDAALGRLAAWLHERGLGGKWRNELLSVADAEGRVVAAIERAAVRALGIATQAVHLVGASERGEVWVQQRALDKAVDPGLWDTLMGGLVAAGESIEETLARETWEEAGLDVTALRGVSPFGRFTVRRPVPDGWMVEHIEMFEAVLPDGIMPVNQDGEVARFECLGPRELVERLQADAFTLEAAGILARWLRKPAAGH